MADSTPIPKPPAPAWAWIFVVACGLIPILTVGGALPGAIGGGGAYACYAFARDGRKPRRTRVLLCLGVTALCWMLFLLLAGGLMHFRARE